MVVVVVVRLGELRVKGHRLGSKLLGRKPRRIHAPAPPHPRTDLP